MNPVIDVINSRHSVRKYKDTPVPKDLLETVVQAGRMAPSGGNNQTSRIYVVSDKAFLQQMKDTAKEEFAKMDTYEGMYKSLRSSIVRSKTPVYDFTYGAPVNIFITNAKGYCNAMADSVLVLANMMLAAQSLGLGTCYTNQTHWLDENKAFRDLISRIGVTDSETVCCGMSLGYPDGPVKEVAHTGNQVIYV